MKTVKYRIKNEIDYLQALAEMYEHESNISARDAALRAVTALRQLSDTINCEAACEPDEFPFAA